jgi:hypothetical protein
MKDFSTHFRGLVEQQLPEDPRVLTSVGDADLIVLATWRISTDPERPRKRSRMIRIVISEEALQDYAHGSDGVRLASDERFLRWLRDHLSKHDPDHDVPLGVEPAPVTWPLSTLDLNG